MEIPSSGELLERVRGLAAYAPLRRGLPDAPAVYLVGGAIRDLLLGLEPVELDLVVEGDVGAVAAELGGESRAHPRFGTVTVVLEGRHLDIATARRERYAAPGALPDVTAAGLEADLERRDFTVNAIALALNGARAGTLLHVPEALDDLAGGRLRVLHPGSFRDDPTRLLRMARYRARLGFEVEPGTAALAETARRIGALDTVSGARVGAELRLLARERDPVAAFEVLRELHLDEPVASGFGLAAGAAARTAISLLGGGGRDDLLVLGLAMRGVAEPDRRPVLERLGFRAADATVILQVAHAEALAQGLAQAERPSEIAAVAGGARPEAVAAAGVLGGQPAAAAARRWLSELRHVALAITGEDLAAAGIAPGPGMGAALRAALSAKLDGRAAGREAELAAALAAASNATGIGSNE